MQPARNIEKELGYPSLPVHPLTLLWSSCDRKDEDSVGERGSWNEVGKLRKSSNHQRGGGAIRLYLISQICVFQVSSATKMMMELFPGVQGTGGIMAERSNVLGKSRYVESKKVRTFQRLLFLIHQ